MSELPKRQRLQAVNRANQLDPALAIVPAGEITRTVPAERASNRVENAYGVRKKTEKGRIVRNFQ